MKETTQFALFLVAIGQQVVESSTDGDGLNFKDAPEFIDEFMQAPEALMGVQKIPNEFRNATITQKEEFIEAVTEKIAGITPYEIDLLLEASVETAKVWNKTIPAFITARQKAKTEEKNDNVGGVASTGVEVEEVVDDEPEAITAIDEETGRIIEEE